MPGDCAWGHCWRCCWRWRWEVRDEPLGVLFLLISSPVAAASFVMVVAAKGDGAGGKHRGG